MRREVFGGATPSIANIPARSGDYPEDALYEKDYDIVDLSLKLAEKIVKHSTETGERFDKMVIIPRGGYGPANTVARVFGFTATEILHMGITHYDGGSIEGSGKFKYGQMPTQDEIEGQNLLVVDETCDTGLTLNHTHQLLKLAGAGLVRTGVLHYKPHRSKTGFTPDWWVIETDAWVVYPWEPNETHAETFAPLVKRGGGNVNEEEF